MPTHQERPARSPAVERCMIIRERGRRLAVGTLLDLSEDGFCIDSAETLQIGERVEIRGSGFGCMAGIVRWFVHNRAGAVLEPYTQGAFDASASPGQGAITLGSSVKRHSF